MIFMTEELITMKKAIGTYGDEAQIDVAIEEMAELTQALIKDRRKGGTDANARLHVCEEIADAMIMLKQLEMIFDRDTGRNDATVITEWIDSKMERLKRRLYDG